MIKIDNVSKFFSTKKALDEVNFSLDVGEVVALIGENGAGKSTLMRIMTGYLPATSGSVTILGYNVEDKRLQALSHVGYVPEISALYGDMLVYNFLEWISDIWQIKEKKKAIIDSAKQMKIIDVLDERIENLSKGYKKRVEIASAILHKPRFLILDEPTDGLDPNQKHDIRIFIKEYAKNKNTVLVSTHVLEDADIADRVLMLSHGKLIKDAKIKEFKKVSKKNNLSEAFRILSLGDKGE
ncbi:MAG: ABC transporter ATP-binding protein [Alphaproteobacteria bacterium]|nr:ABC transporter ATP-binding protein [Alphaproteobacteria bacterium]